MRKIFILLSIIALPLLSMAQLPSDAIFQKYAKIQGYEISNISGFMLKPFAENFASSLKTEGKEQLAKYLESITNIAIIQTTGEGKLKDELISEGNSIAKKGKYTELLSIKNGSTNAKIVSLKNGNKVTEILGYGGDKNEAVMVSIQGNFTEAMIQEALSTASKYINTSEKASEPKP